MTVPASKMQILLARLVVSLVILFVILDVAWHGVSVTALQRTWQNILDRPGGPLTFRFILQPAMATIAALHDGIKDARTGRSPYLWAVFTNAVNRGGYLWDGVISTARIILLGLVMDSIYQVSELDQFYPGEAVIVALTLAFLPYLILRGPIARIARWRRDDPPMGGAC
jgi:hypothetical protein